MDTEFDIVRCQKNVKNLRLCAGMTVEDVAFHLGISKQLVSNWENNTDKLMTKLQYIGVRLLFEEEINNNPQNINLRDCYDLTFSDIDFYNQNEKKVEYAIQKAVEDTQIKKKNDLQNAKKARRRGEKVSFNAIAGATMITLGVGGIAATTFPLVYSGLGIAAATVGVGSIIKDKLTKDSKEEKKLVDDNRASSEIEHSKWIKEALNYCDNN